MLEFIKSLLFKKMPFAALSGRAGERAAAKFLKRERGMKILERNFRSGKTEIDIIARDGDCLVFVEVKTRSESALVDGYYAAVSKRKREAVRSCAKAYIKSRRGEFIARRFDVVEVRTDSKLNVVSISHFENIPY